MTARLMTLVLLLMLSLALPCGSSAAETSRDLADISTSIEGSSLPQDKKASLLTHASDNVAAGVPAADVAVIVKRGLSRGMDGKALEESLDVVLKTHQKGLPVRPVLDRLQQGLSKGVPPPRLTAATKQLVVKLVAADSLVNNLVKNGMKAGTPAEKADTLHTVARALEKTIPDEAIVKTGMRVVKQGASLSKFAAAVASMTSLVEMGMPVDHASRLIHKAVDKGYAESDMLMMEREMSGRMRDGSKMQEIMKGMDSMMNSGSMGRGMDGGPTRGPGSGMGSGSTPHNAPGTGMHHGGGGTGMGPHKR